MKPLHLTVEAFGPFAEKQSLDFQCLAHTPLFLIHGPTGAGKSSLLDAMCFALYGETSGGEKDVKFIRSDFSLPAEETWVEFDFSLAGKTYRIRRSPEQERPKKRGEGTTRQTAQATLWECRAEGDTVLADRWANVTLEITRLTGFDVGQFRQVVVLPQGQFRKFLLSNSAERQIILESLFRTERYRIIENALKEAARDIKAAYDDVVRERDLMLKSEEAASKDELDSQIADMNARIEHLAAALATLEDQEKTARKNLDQGKVHQTLLDEEAKAAQALSKIQDRKEAMGRMKTELFRAQKAQSLTDAEIMVEERNRELEKALARHNQALKDDQAAGLARDRAEAAYITETGRQDDITQTRKALEDLYRISQQVEAFHKAGQDHAKAQAEAAACTRNRDSRKKDLETLVNQIREKTELIRIAGEAASQVDGLALAHDRLSKNIGRLATLTEVRTAEIKADKGKQAAARKLIQFEQELARDRDALEQLEALFQSGQAARLAMDLSPGKPCPVCGSTEHPAKAQSDQALPDESGVKQARQALKTKETSLAPLRDQALRTNGEWAKQVSRRQSLEEELGDLAQANPGALSAECLSLKKRLDEAWNHQQSLPGLKDALSSLTEKEATATLAMEKAVQTLDTALQERARTQAVLEERTALIPQEFRDPVRMASRLTELESFIKKAERSLEDARKTRETSLQNAATASQALVHATDTLAQAQSVFQKVSDDFGLRVSQAGFSNLSDFKQAQRPIEAITAMDTALREFGEQTKAAQDRVDRARKAAENLVMPDMPALEGEVSLITARMDEVRKDKTRLETLLARKAKVASHLAALAKQSVDLESRYAVSGKIAEVAGGRGINTSGMTFQRYVLAALFDDVLYTAGQHLKAMSRNRFDLEREQDRLDRRSASGLDLRVSDAHTGTSRPVSTLSGGESFLAALSLALGLADVVQRYAGGIRLDTLFIDEGFGSLDPETLDLAFKTIADLQIQGRLVGIISHVPELRERIAARLDVLPGKRGSAATFVL